jgi:hypothetical protein
VRQLAERGLALVRLDAPLPDAEFIALGEMLGEPMPETDPAVRPFVERDVLLNLTAVHGATDDVSLQPFATGSLTLHSESSGRPAAQQPRYIVLMCCDPGDDGASAQTVLVSMADVARGLSERARRVLSHTRYRGPHDLPTVARSCGGRVAFSFRDFNGQPLEWESMLPDLDQRAAEDTFRELLAVMYEPSGATGVHWTPGLLVVIDNTYFFHGRTAGPSVVPKRRRHLKRLRLVEAAAKPARQRR